MQAISSTHQDFLPCLKRIKARTVARTQRVFVNVDETSVVPCRVPDWNASPDLAMLKQLVRGYVLTFGYLLGLCSLALTSLKTAGVLFFHNAVHMYPQVFTEMTSEVRVTQKTTHTKAHALLWRAISFIL